MDQTWAKPGRTDTFPKEMKAPSGSCGADNTNQFKPNQVKQKLGGRRGAKANNNQTKTKITAVVKLKKALMNKKKWIKDYIVINI